MKQNLNMYFPGRVLSDLFVVKRIFLILASLRSMHNIQKSMETGRPWFCIQRGQIFLMETGLQGRGSVHSAGRYSLWKLDCRAVVLYTAGVDIPYGNWTAGPWFRYNTRSLIHIVMKSNNCILINTTVIQIILDQSI